MLDNDWQERIDLMISESQDYCEKAYIISLKELLLEEIKRIEQMKGELDGRMWSPKTW
ncbi:hypothetical protein SAMN05421767_10921 [Granulicatella balaenopterae]|uniref:Uncharacterized protein n=1 Tax=Granulicatella balaenopterae TaxID=137733 RepID=A0A1H9JJF3_9LACT|nr:hypothetical protein [Granulicatella balaenopterae]SEQ86950.1 hypothetical protein SAMN05421767_10921 [Granulicatella balaenopterae]